MGDPITMAMIGAGVGAMTNPRRPLQGALLGGAMGGFGGAFAKGALTAGNAASTAMGTTAGGVPAAITGVTPATVLPAAKVPVGGAFATPTMGGTTLATATAPATGAFATPTMPGIVSTNTSTGLIGSTTAPVTMGERFTGGMNALKSDLSDLGSFAKQNPLVAGQGLQAAGNVLFPEPMAAPPAPGLLRGTPSQEQPPQYAMGMPQINLLG
jgi:hypothetical protein